MSESEKQDPCARQKRNHQLVRENLRLAHRLIAGTVRIRLAESLRTLSQDLGFSLRRGDLQLLDNSWYVTHTGLLRLARRKRCRGIHVEAVDSLCDSAANRFVLKATVYPSKESAGFVGYGDADPSNVSLLVRGAEMRMAETRAVNRALSGLLSSLPSLICVSRLAPASVTGSSFWFSTTARSRPFGRFPAVARGTALRLWLRPLFLHPVWTTQRRVGSFSFRSWLLGLYMPHLAGKNNNEFGA
jgi:hypothetical protein